MAFSGPVHTVDSVLDSGDQLILCSSSGLVRYASWPGTETGLVCYPAWDKLGHLMYGSAVYQPCALLQEICLTQGFVPRITGSDRNTGILNPADREVNVFIRSTCWYRNDTI